MSGAFADIVIERARSLGAPLCVGLDPYPERIPALFGPFSVRAIADFCSEILDLAQDFAVAIKLQLALFEAHGPEGFALAADLRRRISVPFILDAKRGDIATTAAAYAEAAYGAFEADCVTINPYLGLDAMEPFAARAQANLKGLAPLVRTSNPGAADFQDLPCGADGAPLWLQVARALAPLEQRLMAASGFSGLMPVLGAAGAEQARQARQALPRSLFLVPGFGAQRGSAEAAVAGFVPGPAGLEGGLVNASRSVLYPDRIGENLADWRNSVTEALQSAQTQLKKAVQADL